MTETMRFVFDLVKDKAHSLCHILAEVISNCSRRSLQVSSMIVSSHGADLQRHFRNVRVREETFTDLVLQVPTAKEVKETGCVPTMQKLLEEV